MFGKKKEQKENAFDRKMNEMISQIRDFRHRLFYCTEDCIVKEGAINLYPEGADKIAAQKDFAKAQHSLICAIAQYDDKLSQITCFAQEHESELTQPDSARMFASSHSLIENQYRNFWRR